MLIYGVGALTYRGPALPVIRIALIAGWSVMGLAALLALFTARRFYYLPFTIAAFAVWWATVQPRFDRDWAPDVARQLHVERHGSHVRLHNVRDFAWRTTEDFTPRWQTRDYDLDNLVAVDLIVSYWMGPAIAHTLVSFAFADGRHLTFSVEIRRLAHQQFSAIGGLFRQNELTLVAADERDIIRTRTTIRDGENVYLYRVAMPRDKIRALFNACLDTADELEDEPRFYNTLLSNCTTIIYDMVKKIVPGIPWDWRLILSGYLPNYLYDLGALDTRLSNYS